VAELLSNSVEYGFPSMGHVVACSFHLDFSFCVYFPLAMHIGVIFGYRGSFPLEYIMGCLEWDGKSGALLVLHVFSSNTLCFACGVIRSLYRQITVTCITLNLPTGVCSRSQIGDIWNRIWVSALDSPAFLGYRNGAQKRTMPHLSFFAQRIVHCRVDFGSHIRGRIGVLS